MRAMILAFALLSLPVQAAESYRPPDYPSETLAEVLASAAPLPASGEEALERCGDLRDAAQAVFRARLAGYKAELNQAMERVQAAMNDPKAMAVSPDPRVMTEVAQLGQITLTQEAEALASPSYKEALDQVTRSFKEELAAQTPPETDHCPSYDGRGQQTELCVEAAWVPWRSERRQLIDAYLQTAATLYRAAHGNFESNVIKLENWVEEVRSGAIFRAEQIPFTPHPLVDVMAVPALQVLASLAEPPVALAETACIAAAQAAVTLQEGRP